MPNRFNLLFVLGMLAFTGALTAAEGGPMLDRTELPVRAPIYPTITTLDARDAKAPPVFEVTAPKGAPNVVVILLDDLGFGGTSTFGGVIETPNLTALVEGGLRYT
jgi:hypothetical protein